MDDATQESLLKRPAGGSPKRAVGLGTKILPSRKAELLGRTSSTSSSLISRVAVEDPYLKTLQQRHLRERELADRLMRQALDSWSSFTFRMTERWRSGESIVANAVWRKSWLVSLIRWPNGMLSRRLRVDWYFICGLLPCPVLSRAESNRFRREFI